MRFRYSDQLAPKERVCIFDADAKFGVSDPQRVQMIVHHDQSLAVWIEWSFDRKDWFTHTILALGPSQESDVIDELIASLPYVRVTLINGVVKQSKFAVSGQFTSNSALGEP